LIPTADTEIKTIKNMSTNYQSPEDWSRANSWNVTV